MAKQYSAKTFLRMVRGSFVNRCLQRHAIDLDLNKEIIKPAVVDELFGQLMALPLPALRLVETDFAAITKLACSAGTAALIREGERKGIDCRTTFDQCHNDYERACWCLVEHPEIFDLAACFMAMDGVGTRRWNRRYVGMNLVPVKTPEGLTQLATMMRESYAKEGRGRHCHVDYYLRSEPERHCFFAYPEDHAKTDLGYSDDGHLGHHARKTAFEVIFAYRPEEGTLEVLAPGGRDRVEDLAACFCASIMGLPELPPQLLPQAYDLSSLKSPDVSFPTDPADGIDRVLLREVRIQLPRAVGWRRKLVFTRDPKTINASSIHDGILATVAQEHLSPADVVVSYASFTFIFASVGDSKAKRITFDVSLPDLCSLRDEPHDQVARKYLRRWGLCVDLSAQDALKRFGFSGLRAFQLRQRDQLATRVA